MRDPKEVKQLADDLDSFIDEHRDSLGVAPTVWRPLDEARKEARRKWNVIKPESESVH